MGKDPVRDKQRKISRRQPKTSKRKETDGDGVAVNGTDKDVEWEDEDEDENEDEAPELVDAARKASKKSAKVAVIEEEDDDDDEEEEEEEGEEGVELEEKEEEEKEEDDEESDIAFSDIDGDDLEAPDTLPYQKLTINNHSALTQALERIALPLSSLPFVEHQSLTTDVPVEIRDVDDDLSRELAFYKQALDAANLGRKKLAKDGIPFARPTDYFAEMLKDDEHMGTIKQKLLDEAANKKAAAEARRQRDLKKFGKQVQFAKLEERNKAKKDTLEKIQVLKRSMFFLPELFLHAAPGKHFLTDRLLQSGREPTPTSLTKQTCSMSPSTMPPPLAADETRKTATPPDDQRQSGRRRIKSMDTEERRGFPRAVTLRPVVILLASRPGRTRRPSRVRRRSGRGRARGLARGSR